MIPYGALPEQTAAERRLRGNAALDAPAAAASAAYRARSGFVDTNDAVTVVAKGGSVDGRLLGHGLADKSAAEQKKILGEKQVERADLSGKIQELAKKRDDYVRSEAAKRGGGGMEEEVTGMLRSQASRIGVTY
jgi:hypothetical protein